jgi:CxxC motif-containing protein (DUF1111 family)
LATSFTLTRAIATNGPTEAPTGFDRLTNGFLSQVDFDAAADVFASTEHAADGLGPVYNASGCGECHATPVLGGSSQIVERRAGRFDGVTFFAHPGGSLIHDRAIDVRVQKKVLPGNNVIALRSSVSILGDGYVEAIDSNTLQSISLNQPLAQRGTYIQVPLLESQGSVRGGRFGWKNQNASLLSFAADAYLNEMGITSPMLPEENTYNGNKIGQDIDQVADPEDNGEDVQTFAKFMRSTKAPPVDPLVSIMPDAIAGGKIFADIGCAVCHTPRMVTLAAGAKINGGTFTVPNALGNKIIHPFSDYLLHDIGTGDGIVQNGGPGTRTQLRTAPLWGLRGRGRLMHDAESDTLNNAIQRHDNQARDARNAFNALIGANRRKVLLFLSSL